MGIGTPARAGTFVPNTNIGGGDVWSGASSNAGGDALN